MRCGYGRLPGVMTILLLVSCGGGGGSEQNAGGGQVAPPRAACFDDYDSANPAWDAFRANSGQVLYNFRDGLNLSVLNLATGENRVISNKVDRGTRNKVWPSNQGNYVAYKSDDRSGRGLHFYDLSNSTDVFISPFSREVNWGPVDNLLLLPGFPATQLINGSPFGDAEFVSTRSVRDFSWADDGSRIALESDFGVEVYTTNPPALEHSIAGATLLVNRNGASNFSANGRHIALVTTGVSSGFTVFNLQLFDLTNGSTQAIASASGNSAPLHGWSPSGNYLAYMDGSSGASLRLFAANSGNSSSVEGYAGLVRNYLWAPGQDRLLLLNESDNSYDQNLYLVNASTSNNAVRIDANATFSTPVWSPDSRYFAYFSGDDAAGRSVIVGDAGSGGGCTRTLERVNDESFASESLDGLLSWSPSGQYLLFLEGSQGTEQQLVAVRADGSGEVLLSSLADTDDSAEISRYGWGSESDTVFVIKRNAETRRENALIFVELDSATVLSQPAAFLEYNGVWMVPSAQE